jgi:hypothetical protein
MALIRDVNNATASVQSGKASADAKLQTFLSAMYQKYGQQGLEVAALMTQLAKTLNQGQQGISNQVGIGKKKTDVVDYIKNGVKPPYSEAMS